MSHESGTPLGMHLEDESECLINILLGDSLIVFSAVRAAIPI